MTLRYLITRPTALVPIVMSLLALAILILALTLGVGRSTDGDEGAAAHIWQLLMIGQMPIVAFFAIYWVPREPEAGNHRARAPIPDGTFVARPGIPAPPLGEGGAQQRRGVGAHEAGYDFFRQTRFEQRPGQSWVALHVDQHLQRTIHVGPDRHVILTC